MPTQTFSTLLPYREPTGDVKYTSHPSYLPHPPSTYSSNSTTHLYNTTLTYDSDSEPLLSPTPLPITSTLTPYDLAHFTATGRPIPTYKAPSGLQGLGGNMLMAPTLLPQRYTDDSIIPAIIVDVIPSPHLHPPKARRGSLLSRLGPTVDGKRRKSEGAGVGIGGEEKGITKVAFMPRREYLKYFARGMKGEYVGTEPYRRWGEEELERVYGQYRPESMRQKGGKK